MSVSLSIAQPLAQHTQLRLEFFQRKTKWLRLLQTKVFSERIVKYQAHRP